MRNKRLQDLATAGRWTLPTVILICTLCWVLTSVLLPELIVTAGEEGGSMPWQSARTLLLPVRAEHLVSFLIYAAIGYFLIELSNRFSIIRIRAFTQTAVYFLLVTVCPEMHLLYAGNVVIITFLFSICFLFKNYQQSRTSGYLPYSFLLISAGSILFPQLTFFSVLWLFEARRFQSFTSRSFHGVLIGWTTPYWMLFGHASFYGQMEPFYRPFKKLATFGDVSNLQILQPWELAILGYLLMLLIVSAAHCTVAGFEDKICTRIYLQLLIDTILFLFVLVMLQPSQYSNPLPLLMTSNSILIGHPFVLTNNETPNIFFIVATVYLILLFGSNVWMPL